MIIIDVQRKRTNETIPPGDEKKLKLFSSSKKFTRITNGTNRYKTRPHINSFQMPYDGFSTVYCPLIKENKKKWACLPFID